MAGNEEGFMGSISRKGSQNTDGMEGERGEIEHEELNWLKMGDVLVRYLST